MVRPRTQEAHRGAHRPHRQHPGAACRAGRKGDRGSRGDARRSARHRFHQPDLRTVQRLRAELHALPTLQLARLGCGDRSGVGHLQGVPGVSLCEVFETDHNQKWLGGACLANYGVGTNFAWDAFGDLDGHKIAGAGINLDWIVGATPVASNLNEAYQSMQSGVYEGYLSASSWWSRVQAQRGGALLHQDRFRRPVPQRRHHQQADLRRAFPKT